MEAKTIRQLWRDESAELVTTKMRPDGSSEITLPYSVLTDKFVRVFVHPQSDGSFIVSDGGDLLDDAYETTTEADVSGPYLQATELLAKGEYGTINGQAFTIKAERLPMLTSAMFNMAEFIQLSTNLAYLSV